MMQAISQKSICALSEDLTGSALMMIQDKLTRDERLRLECLAQAVAHSGITRPINDPEDIVKTAAIFERYVAEKPSQPGHSTPMGEFDLHPADPHVPGDARHPDDTGHPDHDLPQGQGNPPVSGDPYPPPAGYRSPEVNLPDPTEYYGNRAG